MILQPDTNRQIVTDGNLQRDQSGRRSNPGQQKQLRGIVGASRQNDFGVSANLFELPVTRYLNARCAVAVEQIRVVSAWLSTLRLGRFIAGCRYAIAVLQRLPLRWVT